MNENEQRKRKDWVKNAAIIFLSIMLVLTFFSNTIMNYSLPEVATQYVQSGTINAKIRGTGTVEASDPYNVEVKESRKISSVAVKNGDEVKKDDVLFYLEDTESEELKTAEEELDTLILTYMKGLFNGEVNSDTINKVESGKTDSFGGFQSKIEAMNNQLTAAENNEKNCKAIVDSLTGQQSLNSSLTIDTTGEQAAVDSANANLTNAQNEVTRLDGLVAALEKRVNEAAGLVGTPVTDENGNTTLTGGIEEYQKAVDAAKAKVGDAQAALSNAQAQLSVKESELAAAEQALSDAEASGDDAAIAHAVEERDKKQTEYNEIKLYVYDPANEALGVAQSQLKVAEEQMESAAGSLRDYDSARAELEKAKSDRENARNNVTNAQKAVESAKVALSNKTNNSVIITDKNNLAKQLAEAQKNLTAATAEVERLKAEKTKLITNLTAELDLSAQNDQIARKQKEIEELREKSIGTTIKAPVAGIVTSVNYVAGETTKPDDVMAVIQVAGKGFTVSFSVSADQAKKVSVGDMAEPQNAWYYQDLKAALTSIKPDPTDPAQKKLLTFNVEGEVQAGQSLALQLGQRSADYELVVPNSAVREDNNGKFILIVESKSSPLGNRYIATRVDVEVLASDDTNTAISAGLYGYEYVITTSTKPVEAGKQVRLAE